MDDVRAIFGIRLRELMDGATPRGKETVKQLSQNIERETGVSISVGSLSEYRKGQAKANIEAIYAVAKYYGVTSDWLIGLSEARTLDTDTQQVCNFTGLSEAAVFKLALEVAVERKFGAADPESSRANTISALIENESSIGILQGISILRNTRLIINETLKKFYSNPSDLTNEKDKKKFEEMTIELIQLEHSERFGRFDVIDRFTNFIDLFCPTLDWDKYCGMDLQHGFDAQFITLTKRYTALIKAIEAWEVRHGTKE